jgi:hypothetical protein
MMMAGPSEQDANLRLILEHDVRTSLQRAPDILSSFEKKLNKQKKQIKSWLELRRTITRLYFFYFDWGTSIYQLLLQSCCNVKPSLLLVEEHSLCNVNAAADPSMNVLLLENLLNYSAGKVSGGGRLQRYSEQHR